MNVQAGSINGYIFCSDPVLTMGFKFQLQARTGGFKTYIALEFIHERTVHRGQQRVSY
jgi:hypothetical protein